MGLYGEKNESDANTEYRKGEKGHPQGTGCFEGEGWKKAKSQRWLGLGSVLKNGSGKRKVAEEREQLQQMAQHRTSALPGGSFGVIGEE